MKRIVTVLITIFLMAFVFRAPAVAQDFSDYAGKAACFGCHVSVKPIDLAEFNKSGHPWKVQKIDTSKVNASGAYKPFPTGTNDTGVPLASEVLGLGYSYKATDTTKRIGFMIGGFGWKARWMNMEGYIFEGTKAQYNLGTHHPTLQGFGSYNASNVSNQVFALRTPTGAKYNCGACHTTGWKAYDATTSPYRKDNLPGMDGTFFEYGVQCEGCHGPSKAHVNNPTGVKPPRDGFNGCKSCHARGQGLKIPLKSDKQFLDHREQYDQMLFTKHRRTQNMTCVTCHDPHKSTVYDRGGLKSEGKTCLPCHSNRSNITATVVKPTGTTSYTHTCQDCHMPFIGNTAIKQNNNRGDQVSHMWKINTNPASKFQAMFDTSAAKMIVVIPTDSLVAHTLDFACLGCHTTRDLTWASSWATGIHSKTILVSVEGKDAEVPSAFYLGQNYPNPFNPTTTISFGLPQSSHVRITIYDVTGREVNVLTDAGYTPGAHTVTWDGTDISGASVASGMYVYRLETEYFIQAKKMVLTR